METALALSLRHACRNASAFVPLSAQTNSAGIPGGPLPGTGDPNGAAGTVRPAAGMRTGNGTVCPDGGIRRSEILCGKYGAALHRTDFRQYFRSPAQPFHACRQTEHLWLHAVPDFFGKSWSFARTVHSRPPPRTGSETAAQHGSAHRGYCRTMRIQPDPHIRPVYPADQRMRSPRAAQTAHGKNFGRHLIHSRSIASDRITGAPAVAGRVSHEKSGAEQSVADKPGMSVRIGKITAVPVGIGAQTAAVCF